MIRVHLHLNVIQPLPCPENIVLSSLSDKQLISGSLRIFPKVLSCCLVGTCSSASSFCLTLTLVHTQKITSRLSQPGRSRGTSCVQPAPAPGCLSDLCDGPSLSSMAPSTGQRAKASLRAEQRDLSQRPHPG